MLNTMGKSLTYKKDLLNTIALYSSPANLGINAQTLSRLRSQIPRELETSVLTVLWSVGIFRAGAGEQWKLLGSWSVSRESRISSRPMGGCGRM